MNYSCRSRKGYKANDYLSLRGHFVTTFSICLTYRYIHNGIHNELLDTYPIRKR